MNKKTSRKTKIKKGAWFYSLRGSYFPFSWQGWTIEFLVVVLFALGMLAFKDQNISVPIVALIMVPYTLSLGIIATWVASKKS